jgi:DNA polymerase I-like protein with 3'-5' exonuclease and polymerase domains
MMSITPNSLDAAQLLLNGTICLSEIETNGIKIDANLLDANIKQTEEDLVTLRHKLTTYEEYKVWQEMYGNDMNILSRLQCGFVLFDNLEDERGRNISRLGNMGYKCEIFSPTGRPAVSEESLHVVKSNFSKDYVRFLSLQKVLQTYLYGIKNELDSDSVLHPSFNLGSVQSYRSSCLAEGTLIKVARNETAAYLPIELTFRNDFIDVPIEQVKVSDYVVCIDNELNTQLRKVLWAGKTGYRKIIRLHFLPSYSEKNYIDLTPEHKIRMTDGTYIEAQDAAAYKYKMLSCNSRIELGDECTAYSTIMEVEVIEKPVDVYDIQVEKYHNFIANSVCVHNSDSPNFQNMPVRDRELAKLVRSCFVPRSSRNYFIEVDYSGAEVKCATAYHRDSRMLEYLTCKTADMHRDMAAQCFKLPLERVNKQIRNCAKGGFVFAAFYGSYWMGLASGLWNQLLLYDVKTDDGELVVDHLKSVGIHGLGKIINGQPEKGSFYEHIQEVEADFWGNRFSEYGLWKKTTWNEYIKNGYVDFLSGFRCSGVFSRNEVLNLPIQGLSFHCLLWSLIQIQKKLKKYNMKSTLIGQIHDSIVADGTENELQNLLEIIQHEMVTKLHKHWTFLVAPMEVEAEIAPIGASWFEKKEYQFESIKT